MGEEKKLRHIFGPVPSRRLGRSLGVDLIPFKTCSYNCIYCQLGHTTDQTIERKDYVRVSEVLSELKVRLQEGPRPDYITLSGSGEPTLHSGIREVIAGIKSLTDIPVAVLTNGSLLYIPEVSDAILSADLIVPSLDAGDEASFQYVNRPHPDIGFTEMVDGLASFRKKFQGQIWLEVFLLGGVTAIESEVKKIAKLAERMEPDRIQLNTSTRPAAEDYVYAVSRERMEQLAEFFKPRAEVIADYRGVHQEEDFAARQDDVLDMLVRRPCSLDDIVRGLGIHKNEAVKYIEELLASRSIVQEVRGSVLYYKVASNTAQPPGDKR
jgi:wyosine [tRNA(Phe)-imidazoG37] synthetase (radical SAM superfamily)